MSTSLAVPSRTATKEARFAVHITDTQRVFMCSETKSAPLSKTLKRDLHRFEFYQPSPTFCRALVIDIDHIFASSFVFDLPREIYPHAVVFTSQGVQAFWLIEGVPLTSKAHQAPIRFARDVAELLRRACAGDPAVNALSPSKCRNPLFEGAEVLYLADCPPYALKSLSEPLRAFLMGSETPDSNQVPQHSSRSFRSPVGSLDMSMRNESIFRACVTAGHRGEDYETLGRQMNAVAGLPESELAGIFRSVARYVAKGKKVKRETGEPLPESMREFLSEIGRKGGNRKTEAQRAALAKGSRAGNAVKSAQAIGRRAQIQALKAAGFKQREVAEKMGLGIATIKRAWN